VAADAGAQITDLTVDDHACLTFGEAEELFDLTAAYVRDGLAGGLKVMWLSDAGPGLAVSELSRRGIAVKAAMAAGQMTAAGCEGRLLSGTTASVLCQYDRDRFDPVTLASVAAFHTRSVTAAAYHADAVLRICRQYAPPGIWIAGEIDYQAEEPLALALAEAVRLDGDITVNMSALAFIDAFCARMIADTARMLAGSRTVILQCLPEVGAGFARLGLEGLAGVRLVTAGEQ
jgi:anti-anti-sigma regulatory factor